MKSSDLDYDLPSALIAQHRPSGATSHGCSSTTARSVGSGTGDSRSAGEAGDALVVVIDTRVVPARS
jgi:hypothetical protein